MCIYNQRGFMELINKFLIVRDFKFSLNNL